MTSQQKKSRTHKKKKSNSGATPKGLSPISWIFIILAGVATLICFWALGLEGYRGGDTWVKVPKEATVGDLRDTLRTKLGSSMGNRVFMLWKLQGGDMQKAHGAYLVKNGQIALRTSRAIASGRETPIKLTFNNVRTMKQLAAKITENTEITAAEFLTQSDSLLASRGFKKEEYPAVFMPDTYEAYWSGSGKSITEKILKHYTNFWTQERKQKAKELGLTPVQVATIASIVEEETAKVDERPMVARLYLNRFHKNMRLQADPTVKFAVGDFSIKRISGSHLNTNSPYNTYLRNGIPPGPIKMPSAATIDAVLNAPAHNYLYMCARADFSGYHIFAKDYPTHMVNAKRYQEELNRRGIR